jgi:hypothetical protein
LSHEPATRGEPVVYAGALHRLRRGHGIQFSATGPARALRRPARVAQMLALAHRIRAMVDGGGASDQADAARILGLTPPRVSQLLAMTSLAPDIQEEILHLEAVDGVEPRLTERRLRPLTRELSWEVHRWKWAALGGEVLVPTRTPATHPMYEPNLS